MSTVKFIISVFIIWRLFLFVSLYVAGQVIPPRTGFDYVRVWNFVKPYQPVDSPLLYPHANFDGIHYLSIAGEGYKDNGRFFPLYPLAIHFTSFFAGTGNPFGAIQFFTGLILSNIFFLINLFVLYRLVRLDYSDNIAKLSVLFLTVFPTSFFFGSIYSESLFLLLALLSFYYARKSSWLKSSIFALLLATTRLTGIIILPVLIIEFFQQNKKDFSLQKALPLLMIPLGFLSFVFYNYFTWKDAFYFIKSHGDIANSRSVESIVLIPQTLFRYIKILFSLSPSVHEWWIAVLELGIFFFVVSLLFVAWKKKIHSSYILFSTLCFLLPTLSGTFTGLPRYALTLFPIFITLALIKSKIVHFAYIGISIVLLFILFLLFSRGYYIA